MIKQFPNIPPEFAHGKWQGCRPCELEFGDLCYLSRRSPNASDRAIAEQEVFRRLRAAKQRRLKNGK
jgi:hypothetical protein